MGMEFIELEVSKLEDGIKQAMKHFNTTKENLDVVVLQEGKSGLFGIASRPYKLKVSIKQPVSEQVKKEEADPIKEALNMVYNMDGYATFSFEEDGVYLTVFPPEGDGKSITLESVLKQIKFRKIESINAAAVKYAVEKSAALPVKIAETQAEVIIDGQFQLEIVKDEMQAYITIIPPQGGKPVTKTDIMKYLQEAGIMPGMINESAIDNAIKTQDKPRPVLVAQGVPPEDGLDAVIDIKFDLNRGQKKVTVLENGKVDFLNLDLIENAVKGQILAEKIPATEGKTGVSVTGQPIKPRPGKNAVLPTGKNVYVSDDGLKLIAAINGQIIMTSNNKINVFSTYEVNGDVDLSTGNINFVGNVIVRGRVHAGLSIKAEGDIEVHGGVEGAFLEAGGNIIIRGGVNGQEKGIIKADGDVIAKFIENCTIESSKNIQIGEAVLQSTLSAGEKVVVGGRKGSIVGGLVRAKEEVQAKVIGSDLGTPTIVEVGVNPLLREEILKLDSDSKALEENLDKTLKGINVLKQTEKAFGSLPPDKKAILDKLLATHNFLIEQRENIIKRKAEIESEYEQLREGKIRVSDRIFPGTKITIGKSVMTVKEEIKYATIYREKAEITLAPFK